MKLILRNASILQANSKWHKKKVNLLINKGKIEKISRSPINARTKLSFDGLTITGGWLDIGTHSGEPGFEHRETYESLSNAARAGGFTSLAIMPNLIPYTGNSSNVKNLIQQFEKYALACYPIAALSQNFEGTDINEFYDMHTAGAIGFTDGINQDVSLPILLRALEYINAFNGTLIHHPSDHSLASHAQMHEGKINVQLGLKGSPSIFEKLRIDQDINLLEYSKSRLLIHLISSSEGIRSVIQAKRKHKNLFASVSYQNLLSTDEDLLDFNSQLKLQPPLRSERDRLQLIKAIKDGHIDAICSNHFPLEMDQKQKEFTQCAKGSIGLQTIFSALNTSLPREIKPEDWLPLLSQKPYEALNIPVPKIEEGAEANLTMVNLKEKWNFDEKVNLSKSSNSPYIGSSFKGKVIGTFAKNTLYLNP